MVGDTAKMIAVGLVWGATNAIMRRGTILWDQVLKSSRRNDPTLRPFDRLIVVFNDWIKLLLIWQYSVPFFVNLSASATFFAILSHTPISLAVPVTNATTFAATAVTGVLLGEETHLGFALSGTALIVLGVWLCVRWPAIASILKVATFFCIIYFLMHICRDCNLFWEI